MLSAFWNGETRASRGIEHPIVTYKAVPAFNNHEMLLLILMKV
jgi:hypothetical protein